jgi:hypothetical protein
VAGVTVLAGPSAAIGIPSAFVVQFDPGQACTPTDVELAAPTDVGAAAVLSYELCGDGQNSLVLVAVDLVEIDQVVFVGVQGAGSSTTVTRDLAIDIAESFRQA